ncbi:hypothetical protein [Paracoccus fontiphilus]|uniref:Uncharacterized protein n=1 Tax=Paracoccus fontiphilus TaxID=1815556 RepID=A0ABV7IE28_9RHOB
MTGVLPGGNARAAPDDDKGPDPELRPLLDAWRRDGRDLIRAQRAEFDALLAAIEPEMQRRRHARAASLAQVAANHAVVWHPGIFASGALDDLLGRLGAAALPMPFKRGERRAGPLEILHVVTQVSAIGGHVRMLWHWIGEDGGNRHSLAMTRQTAPLPGPLVKAVQAAGGTVSHVNRTPGGLLPWARNLQALLAKADLVVLHVHNQDIIPFLALGGMAERPPVLLVNHADHVFWLGAGLVDCVLSTRQSGHRLCADRRGFPPERNLVLPLCLEPPPPAVPRAQAKRHLGLPEDSVVILTLARSVKYRSLGGQSFADALVPVLKGDRRRHLVAVGPKGSVDWSAAMAQVPGQITVLPETTETEQFFAAADVFVDSFPFSSITSMLEAGLHGLPVVTRYPFGPGCEIMGGDSVGLDDNLVWTNSLRDFRGAVLRLVSDPDYRLRLGRRTRAHIEATNMGPDWRRNLAAVYDAAFRLPPRRSGPPGAERPQMTDLDLFMPFVFGTVLARPGEAARLALARELGLKTMPNLQRLALCAAMALRGELRFRKGWSAWRNLVPEWLTVRLRISSSGGAQPGC